MVPDSRDGAREQSGQRLVGRAAAEPSDRALNEALDGSRPPGAAGQAAAA